MSRIGRKIIPIPKGTKVDVRDGIFTAEGPKGKVSQAIFPGYPVKMDDGSVTVERPGGVVVSAGPLVVVAARKG